MTTQEQIEEYKKRLREQMKYSKLDCCVGCGMTPEAFSSLLEAQREEIVNKLSDNKEDFHLEDGNIVTGLSMPKIREIISLTKDND